MKIPFFFLLLSMFSFSVKAQIVIPFHLVDGYILINAEVNNVKGRLLFDTGTSGSFMINNNIVQLEKDNFLTTGSTGSNQKLDIYLSTIDSIKISQTNLKFINPGKQMHTNFSFMQDSIASDILGTIGYEIIRQYILTIDYNRQIIKLDQHKDYITDLEMITTFYYTNEGNLPEINFTLNNGRILRAHFDTGSLGVMFFEKSLQDELIHDNQVAVYSTGVWYGIASGKMKTYRINNLTYENVTFNLKNLEHIVNSKNTLSLGYSFLKDYVSVWDFKGKTISLYKE